MMRRNNLITMMVGFAVMAAETAGAAAIRVDSGDWDQSGSFLTSTTEAIGFDMSIFGVTGNMATIHPDGSLVLGGGAETAIFNPLFDPDQTLGGNTAQFTFGTTNALFSTPGVEAGFRAEWTVTDSIGALLNSFQLSMFELSSGQYALEFNYGQITFGDDSSTQIGYSTSLGDSFDLIAALGLSFAQYQGIGDDGSSNNCAGTPTALACNNYFANTGAFGPSTSVLPDTANGFFRIIDSNGEPVQGRYLWLSEATQVSEPSIVALMGLGIFALFFVLRGRQSVRRKLVLVHSRRRKAPRDDS